MKKLALTLFLTSVVGYAQIDYDALVKNLEEITAKTDLPQFFEGLSYSGTNYTFYDDRFLRFYDVIIDEAQIAYFVDELAIMITPFNKVEDFNNIRSKLIETYGAPELNDRGYSCDYRWDTNERSIVLSINKIDGEFNTFEWFFITLHE
ncbi:hypothetical protein I2486_06195 [Cellulophaga sp. E16_2]|uniref:hypothetical protein n=1 Tax=Cellulophaga sp. E16_2 TaxID=2789297 RepID=UPI001A919AE0|nr:hypothetical protein [Cellulophaga sp. E16_2]MBO0590995.1 hypothetical protein [Cellulophaga sp. E16_2]